MTLLADVATLEWYPPRPAAPVEAAAGGALGATCPPPPVVEASFHPLTTSALPAPALSLLDRPHSLVLVALVALEERGSCCEPNRLLSVECFLSTVGLG